MAILGISLGPEAPFDAPLPTPLVLTVDYTRELAGDASNDGAPADEGDERPDGEERSGAGQAVATVSAALVADLRIDDYVEKSLVKITLDNASGSALLAIEDLLPKKNPSREPEFTLVVSLTASQKVTVQEALKPSPPRPARRLVRAGRFVPVGFPTPRFRSMTLLVAPIREQDISDDLLRSVFDTDTFGPIALRLPKDRLAQLASLPASEIATVNVELTGRFHVDVSVDHIDASEAAGWLWLLSGDETFVGLQPESDLDGSRGEVPILLPAPSPVDGDTPSQGLASAATSSSPVPLDPSEDELLSDPELFSDDPGSSCRPFSNHGRIVSEHGFHTILRVEQPTIGGRQSVPPPDRIPPYSPRAPSLLTAGAVTWAFRWSG